MTKLSTSYIFESVNNLVLSNTTGFSPDKADGFLNDSVSIDFSLSTYSKSFKLSEVYFITVLIGNPYGKDKVILNLVNGALESPIQTVDADFPNSVKKTYEITDDGYYILGQFIAINKTLYDANKNTVRFTNNKYIVYDSANNLLQVAYNGTYTTLTAIEMLDDKLTDIDFMRSYHKIVKTDVIYNCYMTQMESYIKSILSNCDKSFEYKNILILYMTLQAIKYRTCLCEYEYAQKNIEWVNSCVSICSNNTNSVSNSTNCNCNG